MRVFVTGASGHIASALIPVLVSAGHEVTGLARSDDAAAKVAAMGAEVHRGDLQDLDGLGAAAAASDGVIHLAFRHDAMLAGDLEAAVTADRDAINALAEPLKGKGKALVGTSGTLMLLGAGLDRTGTEDDTVPGGYRVDAENAVIGFAAEGIHSSVVRLPPVVHSSLDKHGFIPMLIARARAAGRSGYLGDGSNRWPAGHTLDAAHLYRLAVESAAPGSRLHAVGDEGVALRQIAETIGRHLDVPCVQIPEDEAEAQFGWLAGLVAADNPTSSALTQERLGWTPTHPGLIADMDEGHYFA